MKTLIDRHFQALTHLIWIIGVNFMWIIVDNLKFNVQNLS